MERLTAPQFAEFQSLIYAHSGIRLDDRKVTLLSSRLQRRLRALDMTDADDYLRHVKSRTGKTELTHLLDVVTTNETSFFRTQSHFQWFTDGFLEQMHRDHASGNRPPRLRIWSAACSTGAEPYSLAFCLSEKRFRLSEWKLTVLATDLSVTSIETARLGRYKPRMIEGVPPAKCKRYFRTTETDPPEYVLRDEFRSMVTFATHNLMHRIAQPSFDCVFLRNVLIYFDEASKQTVLDHMVASLCEGGYLVIGPSEGIYGLDNPLEKISTFLYRKTRTHIERGQPNERNQA